MGDSHSQAHEKNPSKVHLPWGELLFAHEATHPHSLLPAFQAQDLSSLPYSFLYPYFGSPIYSFGFSNQIISWIC